MLKNFACGAKISENLHIFIGFGAKIAAEGREKHLG